MKFHKDRTAIKSPLNGIRAYHEATRDGLLRRVVVHNAFGASTAGVWRRLNIRDLRYRSDESKAPMEIAEVVVPVRAAVVDELTRHPTTYQTFIPILGDVSVIVAPNLPEDPNQPDPDRLVMVPASPGEAVEVAAGTWHTLPFTFVREAVCLSIMHRHDLDSYHDVRDLPALGWVGFLEWTDPE